MEAYERVADGCKLETVSPPEGIKTLIWKGDRISANRLEIPINLLVISSETDKYFTYGISVSLFLVYNLTMLSIPQMLMIAGTGRDSGKTTLACRIIHRFCGQYPMVGIKIAPHMHAINSSGQILFESPEMIICRELRTDASKDSSRMLAAGASNAYFVAVSDNELDKAFTKLCSFLREDEILVCESGGLRILVEPGVFLMLNKSGNQELKPATEKLRPLVDKWITFNEGQFDFDISSLQIFQRRWTIQPNICNFN